MWSRGRRSWLGQLAGGLVRLLVAGAICAVAIWASYDGPKTQVAADRAAGAAADRSLYVGLLAVLGLGLGPLFLERILGTVADAIRAAARAIRTRRVRRNRHTTTTPTESDVKDALRRIYRAVPCVSSECMW